MENRQEVVRQRLASQRLIGEKLDDGVNVVEWMGAIQAQDYEGAKWTVGMRTRAVSQAQIEQDLTDGKILRTHLLRATWHFASARDIRWLLALTGPRIMASNAGRHRQLALDEDVFRRSQAVMEGALSGGKHQTRQEMQTALASAGIEAKSSRLAHIMMAAELAAVVCSGAKRGKQFTYALLEERVPAATDLSRDEALAELVKRYFSSHGPATAADFARWSNLTLSDTQRGIEIVGSAIERLVFEGTTYYAGPTGSMPDCESPVAHLLSPYDDFTLGYKDHAMNVDPVTGIRIKNAVYPCVITIDGEIVGTWQSGVGKEEVVMAITPVTMFSTMQMNAIEIAINRYEDYVGKRVRVEPM